MACHDQADPAPLSLRTIGSFFVGGRAVQTAGAPVEEHVLARDGVPVRIDPNGTTWLGQMYVQYAVPVAPAPLPVLFWHGGSLTGATWETTPDGREGWYAQFLRLGWPCYVVGCGGAGPGRLGAARPAFRRPRPAANRAGQLHPVPHRPARARWQPG